MNTATLARAALAMLALSTAHCGEGDSGQGKGLDAGSSGGGANSGTSAASGSSAVDASNDADASSNTGLDSGGSATGTTTGGASQDAATMGTTGPTKVDFVLSTPKGVLKFIHGFAYYDPMISDRFGEAPMLKIVLTDWNVTSCDPQGIVKMSGTMGKNYLYCKVTGKEELTKSGRPYYDAYVQNAQVDGIGFVNDLENWGCMVELTSGDSDGGEQVVGTLTITNGVDIGATVVKSGPIQINHCGVIDTIKANI